MASINIDLSGASATSFFTRKDAVKPAPGLHLYRLKFPEEPSGRPAKDVEFSAADGAEALIIAHEEARTRSAELWCDGRKLCEIRRDEREVWEIWPAR